MKISEPITNVNDYEIALANLLKKKSIEERQKYGEFDNQVRNGIGLPYNEIFELVTGGIKVFDWEWELDNSPYKDLFGEKIDDSYLYAIPLEDSILLRGPYIYYYMACYKEKYKNPTFGLLSKWNDNIQIFIQSLFNCLTKAESQNEINNILERKYHLGILEQLRHIIVVCLNAKLSVNHRNENKFIDYYADNEDIQLFYKELSRCYSLYETLLFVKNINRPMLFENLMGLSIFCKNVSDKVFKEIIFIGNEKLNSRCFNLHREADSFIENYVSIRDMALNVNSQVNLYGKKVALYGVLNGAIEFPALMFHFCGENKYTFNYVCINGDYLSRHVKSEEQNLPDYDKIDNYAIIMDDNVMTGITLEIAMNYILEHDRCKILKFFLLRHPELNRISQMDALGKAVSIEFLNENCLCLFNHSPYSKIKPKTNYYKEYLDELGVFTLTGEYFLRYLYKNGLFLKNSEVYYVGTYRQQ